MDWRHRALCRDEDPELFFPIGNTGPAIVQLDQAKAVCRRCTVTDECLSWALESGQDAVENDPGPSDGHATKFTFETFAASPAFCTVRRIRHDRGCGGAPDFDV